MSTKIDELIRARGDQARAKLMNSHPCNLLCSGATHVDLVYAGARVAAWKGDRLESGVKARYEWLHEVEVLEVKRVEAPPPTERTTQAILAGNPVSPSDPGTVTLGVWWRLPEGAI